MKNEEQAIVEMLAEYATIFGVDDTRTWDVRVVLPYYAEPAMMIDRARGVIPLPSHAEVVSLFQIGVDKLIEANFARTESPAITAKLLSPTIGIAHALNIRYRQDGSEMQRFGTTYSLNKQDDRWKIVVITVHDYDPVLASMYETKIKKNVRVAATPNQSFLQQLQEAANSAPDPRAAAKAQMQLIGRWIAVSPVEFFNELREQSPIYKTPAFTIVTRHEDVRDVLTLNDIFTTDLLRQNMLKFIGNTVVELPPSPEYERRKSILRLAFPKEDLNRYRQILLEESSALLSNLKEGTPFDVVDYAKKLPAAAMARYLGLGALPVDKVVQWMHDINEGAVRNLGNSPALNEPAAAASAEVKPRIREILRQTRAKLSGVPDSAQFNWITWFLDLLGVPDAPPKIADQTADKIAEATVLERYLRMQSSEETYTADEDIVSSLLFMMSACVDLTATSIVNIIVELMNRPGILQQAIAAARAEKDDEIGQYAWEALRFRQPSPGVINTCERDYTLGKGTDHEQTIQAGTLVLGCSVSAMHDPSVIEEPTEFRIGRPEHLAYTFFEAGLHTCHGKYFSMVQVPLAVKQLLRLGVPTNADPFPISQGYPTEPFRIEISKG